MENTVNLLRLAHKVALSALLLLIATIPLIININIVTAFVILPAFLIFIFILSIIIEQKLNRLALNKASINTHIKTKRRCAIINCLHKNCLG